jgi:hypothetical protein
MKDSTTWESRMARIHEQTGTIDSVLSEDMTRDAEGFTYRASCRFSKLPAPLLLTLAITSEGRLSGLAVRPAEPARPYDSPFLDYQTRTRLELPFEGEWTVFWGGRTPEQNYHVISRSQRFAYDLVIRKDGQTHRNDGTQCSDYWCYGARILAPAAGTVVWLEDGHPDQVPGTMDPAHPIGNGIVLDHGQGEFSLFAHLQPGSLKVKMGERVKSGQWLGLCGNSGNTSEPHLHYHLQNGIDLKTSDGLPAFFENMIVDDAPVQRAEILKGQRVRRAGR